MSTDLPRTPESSCIQQHLANERTFLAWLRTAIALKGIGFIATSLHFTTPLGNRFSSAMAMTLSAASFSAGTIIIIAAALLYFKNRKTINTGSFTSSSVMITASAAAVILVMSLLFVYFLTTARM
ncbi:YidH family protein [Alteribacter natronophilus]|uniref:YidH family protein n=1 Tax=Alteribacter natronophilus TaxID=2583810 RepID=UPI00110EDFBB|nr:DUF202 domain-containing protein [Alteribacter natronophilus]TMW71397.1 DUF202 domain-containing protein [Alteribacter natronophilus]